MGQLVSILFVGALMIGSFYWSESQFGSKLGIAVWVVFWLYFWISRRFGLRFLPGYWLRWFD